MIDLNLGDTRTILSACMGQNLLRNQAAYVLATAYWETNRTMKPVEEAYWLSESWRKENLRYYPWHGRGYVQLTWETNYHKAKAETGVDMVADPTLAMRADVAAQVLVVGSRDGWFTGKRLDDYITLESSNYRGARRVINGTDKAAAIAEIAREYEAALSQLGYGVEPEAPIINDRLDGTPARESVSKSKTMRAQVRQWVGTALLTGGGAAATWWDGQSEGVQIAVVIAATVGVIGLLMNLEGGIKVVRERIKNWDG